MKSSVEGWVIRGVNTPQLQFYILTCSKLSSNPVAIAKKFRNCEQWDCIYTNHCSSDCKTFNNILFSTFPFKNKISPLSSHLYPFHLHLSSVLYLSTKSEALSQTSALSSPSYRSISHLSLLLLFSLTGVMGFGLLGVCLCFGLLGV